MQPLFRKYIGQIFLNKSLNISLDPVDDKPLLDTDFFIYDFGTDQYVINIASDHFTNALIEVAEEELNELFPTTIQDCFVFIGMYEIYLQKKSGSNIFKAYEFIIKPFKVASILKLHKQQTDNVITFFHVYMATEISGIKQMYRYEEYFVESLFYLDIEVEQLYNIITTRIDNPKRQTLKHLVANFLIKLPGINFRKAAILYQYGKFRDLINHEFCLSLLLAGLHDNGYEQAFSDGKLLLEEHQSAAMVFFGAVKYKSPESIDYVLGLGEKIYGYDLDARGRYAYTLSKVLIQGIILEEQIQKAFTNFLVLLSCKTENTIKEVLFIIENIDGYENERYNLFNEAYDQELLSIQDVKTYFSNFKNPAYFFDFFTECSLVAKLELNTKLFEEGLDHLFGESHDETEMEILKLLSHEQLFVRLNGLKLFVGSHSRIEKINLLLLDTEIKQLRAMEGMLMFPMAIENLLPLLLPLRKSIYPNVYAFLREKLAVLIYEVYYAYALELISAQLEDTEEDNNLRELLNSCLQAFQEKAIIKKSIKDLDPWANEKSLIYRYRKTEAEVNAESINDIDRDESLSLHAYISQKLVIVRGNAMRLNGGDIIPLMKYEISTTVDSRAFKDTDMFEIKLNNPQSQF